MLPPRKSNTLSDHHAPHPKENSSMRLISVLGLVLVVSIAGCAAKALLPVAVKIPTRTIRIPEGGKTASR
jgi:hypothetical protein